MRAALRIAATGMPAVSAGRDVKLRRRRNCTYARGERVREPQSSVVSQTGHAGLEPQWTVGGVLSSEICLARCVAPFLTTLAERH